MNSESLRCSALNHLWFPYTDINVIEKIDFPIIEKAEGVYLHELDGKVLLDGISSWWCVNFGHSHPKLVSSIIKQAGKLQHSILGGIAHPNVIKLAEKICKFTPDGLEHVYFAGDGASAIEAALKMSLQYWYNQGNKNKIKFICLEDGYHGDTLGAVGVGYVDTFHKYYKKVIQDSFRACSPHCSKCPYEKEHENCKLECFLSMEKLIEEHYSETAAVIVEPLCQGAGGIRIYPEEYLVRLRNLCDKYNLLLIADEIAVGFARTGKMFACDYAGIVPDIMCIGKGMTGGYLPMSAAVSNDKIYNSFRSDNEQDRTFYHGHTFCGNPITSAVALAALELYEELDIIELIKPRIKQFKEGMEDVGTLLNNSKILTLGLIGSIEIDDALGGKERALQIAAKARELGLFIRPLGSVIYLWPPLVSSEEELNQMLSILQSAVRLTA
ncbi:MAG TPA: adenosylmethionine--8-amino-7-oxononanoate transaminase [Victivallales bacterium]|nr:adenosylmethionine--8-amino-7-oxononanoate transaminase [Victivallales bacterium]